VPRACPEPFEQPCRTGQGFDQHPDHGTFDLLSGQTPNLPAIRAGFADRRAET
jgi:hypothetical protein